MSLVQPVLFIPHGGGPCFFMDWDPPHTWDALAAFLRSIPGRLPAKPDAILLVSAHWETREGVQVTSGETPELSYDYAGFPAHTYKITYPAPGFPSLAQEVVEALTRQGISAAANPTRPFDHGMFIPLKVAFPDADIPVVQISLLAGLDPATHLAMGKALEPFRARNVLIIGSGMSYHNMRGLFGAAGAHADAEAFSTWMKQAIGSVPGVRDEALFCWEEAPAARASHPREEHLLPLMVIAGAAGADVGHTVFDGEAMGVRLLACSFGDFKAV